MGVKHETGKAMAGLVICIAVFLSVAPAFARQAQERTTSLPTYDLSKEMRVQGTIRNISMRSSSAAGLPGTHLMLRTDRGLVDAHLGSGVTVEAEHMRLRPGQPVVLTGVMTRYNGGHILVVRILTTSTHIYVLRNERGMPVRALAPHVAPVSAPPPLEEGL